MKFAEAAGFPFVLVLVLSIAVLLIDFGIVRGWFLGDCIGSSNQLG